METQLCEMICKPCQGGIPPLEGQDLQDWHKKLGNGWELVEDHHITKTYSFESFRQSLDFTVKVGELAEEIGHHPEIHINFRKVTLELWTHKIDGLADADFIYAAKVDALVPPTP